LECIVTCYFSRASRISRVRVRIRVSVRIRIFIVQYSLRLVTVYCYGTFKLHSSQKFNG